MIIGGLLKTSLIDFPGTICAVVYTCGCNLRCPFCHNPDLVIPDRYRIPISDETLFSFLERRRGQLEGITLTGGEPLMHADAPDFLARIRALGFKVKLDTNGFFPGPLKTVLERGLADYVAMDVKAPVEKYAALTGVSAAYDAVAESISLIKMYAPKYEFRTTVPKNLLNAADIGAIIRMINPAQRYVVQRFRCEGDVLDAAVADRIFKDPEFESFKKDVAQYAGGTAVCFR